MVTLSLLAKFLACTFVLTLKPTIIALVAVDKETSDSLISPIPVCKILILILPDSILSKLCSIASLEPWTSAFIIIGKSIELSDEASEIICSIDVLFSEAFSLCRLILSLYWATSLALDSFSTTTNSSPACGAPERPKISTG